ncbi:hypothetical protein [Flavivirga spongiicola]|uniref:Uncharacterized protein n=1 Tax=Flavivirga spongiicola TaxID=421621 RepID=A0ABU7XP41_9FLAO|nr:hypothetical protein [Flavivirga sp. MEBiC05379]MDO5981862.1 hypothetical protein [Flavivirga sp. MEBiC05379]
MDYIEFEKVLGKHISIAEEVIGTDFENKLFGKSYYYIADELIKKEFCGTRYNMLTIMTNEKDTVQSITVHFQKVIDRQFYDVFIEKYGKPDNIQIIENRKVESESVIKDDNGKIVERLRKSTLNLKEGSFEEKPLYIIWKKEGFEIKVFLKHKQNISEITFSIKNT